MRVTAMIGKGIRESNSNREKRSDIESVVIIYACRGFPEGKLIGH